jgi:hypothetical protein
MKISEAIYHSLWGALRIPRREQTAIESKSEIEAFQWHFFVSLNVELLIKKRYD